LSLTNPNVKINVKIDRENGAKKSVELGTEPIFFYRTLKILLKLKNSAVLKINSAAVFVSRMFSKKICFGSALEFVHRWTNSADISRNSAVMATLHQICFFFMFI
jgi:hypothetical protein